LKTMVSWSRSEVGPSRLAKTTTLTVFLVPYIALYTTLHNTYYHLTTESYKYSAIMYMIMTLASRRDYNSTLAKHFCVYRE
jgi:hypothetical protein